MSLPLCGETFLSERGERFQDSKIPRSLRAVAESESLWKQDEDILQRYICSLYGAKHKMSLSLNELRFTLVEKAYSAKPSSKYPLGNLRGLNPCTIPPCMAEFTAHLKRSCFIARMWADADKSEIRQHPTAENGWNLMDGLYQPIWFEGNQMPDELVPITGPEQESGSEDESEYEFEEGESTDESDFEEQ